MSDYLNHVPIVTIDIETLPQLSKVKLKERASTAKLTPPSNYKNPEAIEKWETKERLNLFDKMVKQHSLNPIHGKIISVAIDIDGDEFAFYGKNENQLLTELMHQMPERYRLLSFNGICFDVPFINRRLKKHGISDRINQVKKYDVSGQHIDLMLAATEHGLFTSSVESFGLKALCEWEGVHHPGGEGSDVFKWYCEDRIGTIADYNIADVRATRELAIKMGEINAEVTV